MSAKTSGPALLPATAETHPAIWTAATDFELRHVSQTVRPKIGVALDRNGHPEWVSGPRRATRAAVLAVEADFWIVRPIGKA
jgi:hypothetical protein